MYALYPTSGSRDLNKDYFILVIVYFPFICSFIYDTHNSSPIEELRNYCGEILAELFNMGLNQEYDNNIFNRHFKICKIDLKLLNRLQYNP